MITAADASENDDGPELMARAREGDPEAFCGLVRAHQSRLFRQAVSLCGNTALAEDLTQETFLTAWRRLDRFHGKCQFFTWLCGILLNLHRNAARQRRPLSFSILSDTDQAQAHHFLNSIANTGTDPADNLQSMERNAAIQRCLNRLPEKHRQVVYLRFFVDNSIEGIAGALDCSPGTVKSRLFHALDKLMQMPEMKHLAKLKDKP